MSTKHSRDALPAIPAALLPLYLARIASMEGARASAAGAYRSENPYRRGTPERREWRAGWEHAALEAVLAEMDFGGLATTGWP